MAQVNLIPTNADLLAGARDDELLVGAVNGVNQIYFLPNTEKALNFDPGVKVKVFYNGLRLNEGFANDYTIDETAGPGTGFDRITLLHVAPTGVDKLTADYYVI